MRYLQENGAWYKTYHEPFFLSWWYEWLEWIVSLEWILDLGIVFLHLNPQIEPERLYYWNLNCTNASLILNWNYSKRWKKWWPYVRTRLTIVSRAILYRKVDGIEVVLLQSKMSRTRVEWLKNIKKWDQKKFMDTLRLATRSEIHLLGFIAIIYIM